MKTATPVMIAAHSSVQQLLRHTTRAVLLCGCLGACSQLPRPAERDAPTTPSAPATPTSSTATATTQLTQPAAAKGKKPPPATQPGAPSTAASAASATASAASAATPGATPPQPAAPQTATSAATLRIDSAQSLIAITVRRGGMLARLGHDHLVASHTVSGSVSPARNRADFQFRLDQLTVDEADLRVAAGLQNQPSADAVAGTRTNMLTKALDAEHYPLVLVHAERGAPGQPLQVAITLHGVTRAMAIPAQLREAGGVMTVSGTVNLKQSDFGIVPFAVMGGAIAVQDQLELRFSLVAR